MHFQNIKASISFPNNNVEGGEKKDRLMEPFKTEGWNEVDSKSIKVPDATANDNMSSFNNSDSKCDSTYQNSLPSPTPSIEAKSLKRSSSNKISTTSASLIKWPCTKSVSSIRAALQNNEKNQQQQGLLRYFNKATKEEHCKYLVHMDEEMKNRMDDTILSVKTQGQGKKMLV